MIPTTVLTIREQSWGRDLSPAELELFLYDDGTLNHNKLLEASITAQYAMDYADSLFPGQYPDGTPRNAFQHAYLSAMLTQKFGSEFAESLTNAHETGYGQDEPNGLTTFMDRHNNAVGISIAEANPYASAPQFRELILEALENGELVVLDVVSVLAGEYSANTIYPSNQCPQLCSYP